MPVFRFPSGFSALFEFLALQVILIKMMCLLWNFRRTNLFSSLLVWFVYVDKSTPLFKSLGLSAIDGLF